MPSPIDPARIGRILVTRTDRIGDVVLSTPVFSEIKKRYPKSHLAVLVLSQTEEAVRGNPWVDEVIVYDKLGHHRRWWNTVRFALELKQKRFDVSIHLNPSNRIHWLAAFAGIPVRIGYEMKNYHVLTHSIEETKQYGKRHEADYNFDLLELIAVPRPERYALHFPISEPVSRSLQSLLPASLTGPYAVFHPSASCPSKIWPPERFAEVADRLKRDYRFSPVIIGEGEGVVHAGQMQRAMREQAVNLAGQLSLGLLGGLLRNAALLVSNDSGPVHVASAVGTPVVSIFGRNRPGLNAARWRPISERSSYIQKDVGCVVCPAHNCQIGFECLRELSVEEVMKEVVRYAPV